MPIGPVEDRCRSYRMAFGALKIVKILLSEAELEAGVQRMAGEISAFYNKRPITIVGVLTGCVVMLADLIRRLDMPLRIDFIQASSYRGGTERGPLTIHPDLRPDVSGQDVLLVDDIFDTGHTLVEVIRELRLLRPASIRSAVLLSKVGRQEVEFQPDHVAFQIPDEFVVGYGLDYRDQFRNLPHVAVLGPEDIVDRPQ